MNAIATMTSRGQVTFPRRVREVLNSRLIEFDVQDDVIMVRPVRSVAGGLAMYAKKPRLLSKVRDEGVNGTPSLCIGRTRLLSKVRDEVWKEVADEKVQVRPS